MDKKTLLLIFVLAIGLGMCLAILPLGTPSVDPTDPSQPPVAVYDIQITEISAKNETILSDNFGRTPDYIEIYNSGSTISLKGFRITSGKKTSEPLGDLTLAAGEYRVIFLSDDLTGFGISAGGGDTIQDRKSTRLNSSHAT